MSSAPEQHSILVVDDTPANIGILLDTLSKAGYRVRVASDGESALEQLQYSPPDLVLLDVMMPGMDGFETCRRLPQLPKLEQLPVVFMTALSDIQDKVRAFAAGADDYITKPFQHEEVLARAEDASANDPAAAPVYQEVQRLARQFDFKGVRRVLEQAREPSA